MISRVRLLQFFSGRSNICTPIQFYRKVSYKMKRLLNTAIIVAILTTFHACVKIEQLPPEPRIEFRSFTVIDTTDQLGNQAKAGKLTFFFEDGDGNVGDNNNPAAPETSVNMFLSLYRKSGGVMVPASSGDPIMPTPFRIPYMERLGQNKILRGEITVVMLYLFYSESDTLMYDFYIRDRDLNLSNTATTCEIPIAENGTCTAGI